MGHNHAEPMIAGQETLIFLHIPKAGGSTLRQLLHKQYPAESIYKIESDINGDILRLGELNPERLQQIRLVTGHMAFGLHQHFERARYITLLRDPLKRVVSEYQFIYSNPYHVLYESVSKMSLLDYLDCGLSGQISNGQTRLIAGIWKDGQCGVPGTREVGDADYQQALANLDTHFVLSGTMVNYDQTLLMWMDEFDWRWPLYLRSNVTPKRFDPPSDKEIDAIIARNQWDIQLYRHVQSRQQKTLAAMPAGFQWKYTGFSYANWLYGKARAGRLRLQAARA